MALHYGLFSTRVCYTNSDLALCMKLFFGYRKYASVTQALFETGVPSFDTVVHNAHSVLFKVDFMS